MKYTLRALSLLQPWASAVVLLFKEYETRSWETDKIGPFFLHASKGVKPEDRTRFLDMFCPGYTPAAPGSRKEYPLPTAAIIGLVTLIKCERTEIVQERLTMAANYREMILGDYSDNRYAWQLAKVIQFDKPVPYTGALGFWDLVYYREDPTQILSLAMELQKKIDLWPGYQPVLDELYRAYEILRKDPGALPQFKKPAPSKQTKLF